MGGKVKILSPKNRGKIMKKKTGWEKGRKGDSNKLGERRKMESKGRL